MGQQFHEYYRLFSLTVFFWSFIYNTSGFTQNLVNDTLLTIQGEDILFETDSFNLDSLDILKLNAIFRPDTVYRYLLTGHTDADGSVNYNLKLSEKRVLAVQNYLTRLLDIDSSRISIDFKGESEPKASNRNESGKQLNRRVTVHRQYFTRLRSISGVLISTSDQPIEDGFIFMQSRYYRDSFPVENNGNFLIHLPDQSFVRLNATARDHFYIDTLIKVTSRVSQDVLEIGLPYLDVNQRYVLPQMHFVGNQDVLLERSLSSLDALTKTMINSSVCAIIEGHVNRPNTHPRGPGTFSFNLSLARAKMVFNHLTLNGVDSVRINPIGYSNWYMDFPFATTDKDQELNRRVEMVIKECEGLFIINQSNAVMPDKIGGKERVHKESDY